MAGAAYDPDGDALTFELVSGPTGAEPGTFAFNPDRTFSHTPAAGMTDQDAFTYRVTDGVRAGLQAVVTLLMTGAIPLKAHCYDYYLPADGKVTVRAQVALVAGGKYTLTATFRIGSSTSTSTEDVAWVKPFLTAEKLHIEGSIPGFDLKGLTPTISPLKGETITVTWKDVPAPAVAGAVTRTDQTWKVTLDGDGGALPADKFESANRSSHDFYVLPSKPVTGMKLYSTVAKIAAEASAGLKPTATKDEIILAAMKKFETRKLVRSDGTPMTYYRLWSAASRDLRNVEDLLLPKAPVTNGDGNCEAWTKLFLEVLKAQGVTPPADAAFGIQVSSGVTGILFVKSWDVPDDTTKIRYPAGDDKVVGNLPIVFASEKGRGYIEIRTLNARRARLPDGMRFVDGPATLRGQGNDGPLAAFNTHMLAKIEYVKHGKAMVALFDPSYGTEPIEKPAGTSDDDLLKAWQFAALDCVGNTPSEKPGKVLEASVTKIKDTTPLLVKKVAR